MLQSLKYSHLALRIGLAIVFFWFGIDKFFHPDYWVNAWMSQGLVKYIENLGPSGADFMYMMGIFEILVGVSLLSTLFIRFFTIAGVIFLASITAVHGFNEVLIRDVGLIGGLLALFFWPSRRFS